MAGLELYIMITGVLLISGATMLALSAYHRSAASQRFHISDAKRQVVTTSRFSKTALLTSALSFALIYGTTFLLEGFVFHSGPSSALRMLGQSVAVLLFYDFIYYLMHRYPFHEWGVLKKVHAVHHIVKHPAAGDSLFLHPLENFIGLALLWVSIFVLTRFMGPMHVYAFGGTFLVYSLLNIVVHMGFEFRGPMRVFSYLGERHYKHHASMKAGNYANLFPFYDMIFGSEEA